MKNGLGILVIGIIALAGPAIMCNFANTIDDKTKAAVSSVIEDFRP